MAGHVRVVLVEPREAGNVGAVARAMKNFGFGDLVVVGEHPELMPVAGWWASGADDLVAAIRFEATLVDALEGAHITIATTSARGRNLEPALTPGGVAELRSKLGENQTLALVFGREDRGLTTEETAICHRTAVIPANSEFPTMNLAQSACVFAYELSRPDLPSQFEARPLAETAQLERFHRRAQKILEEIGFLHEDNSDRIYREMRALAGRAAITERELVLLLGIVSQLEWRLRDREKS